MLIIGGGPHALAVLSALHEKSLAFAQFASEPVFNQRVGIDSLQKIGTGARASLEHRAGTSVSVGSHLRCNPTRSRTKPNVAGYHPSNVVLVNFGRAALASASRLR